MRPIEHIEAKRAEIRRLAVRIEDRAGTVTPDSYALRLASAAMTWAIGDGGRDLNCMLSDLAKRAGQSGVAAGG